MKNITKFALTILAASVISACGGSGGSSNNTTTTVNNGTDTSNTSNSPVQTTTKTGQYTKILDAKGTTHTLQSTSREKLIIDGHEVILSRPGIYAGGWTNITSAGVTTLSCCGVYQNSNIGYYDLGEGKHGYVFYNGTPTTNMPTSGVATYTGHFLYGGNATDNTDEDLLTGKANFNADFSNKKLTGQLQHDSVNISLDSNIAGNSFSGNAVSSADTVNGNVTGQFYGNSAAELAGDILAIKDNEIEWGAAFIGKK